MDARLYSSADCVTRLGRLVDEFGPTVGPPMGLPSLDTVHAVLISSRSPAVSRRQSPSPRGYRVSNATQTSRVPAHYA